LFAKVQNNDIALYYANLVPILCVWKKKDIFLLEIDRISYGNFMINKRKIVELVINYEVTLRNVGEEG